MKFSLLSYGVSKSWPLDKLIEGAVRLGFAGIELRAELQHGHGVELELSAAERKAVRRRVQDAYLELVAISCSSRFESPDPAKRAEMMERTKRFVDLAADVGASNLRVCGNDMPAGVERGDCIAYVGDSLGELADYAAAANVDILLEMHGEFNNWHYSLAAVKRAARPNIGLLYNSDNRDLVGGSVAAIFSRIQPWLRHVHLHDLASGFPYDELFRLLKQSGYDGYISPEILVPEPTPEDYLSLYVAMMKQLRNNP